MTELKPCPFCGHKASVFYVQYPAKGYVRCNKCSAKMQLSTAKRSIEAWNRRVSDE